MTVREITLTNGAKAIVDGEDFDFLSQWAWGPSKVRSTSRLYAIRFDAARKCAVSMHRTLIQVPDGMQIDHIDNDGLNNRRSNLRVCTHGQNVMNRGALPKHSQFASRFKGVFPREYGKDRGWRVQIFSHGKVYRIPGQFKNEEDAARAYDKLALQHHGEFAHLNFPALTTQTFTRA